MRESALWTAWTFWSLVTGLANGLMFYLEPNGVKCLRDEINKDVLITGEYTVGQAHSQVVDLTVTDNKGQHYVNRENIGTGKFGFTTDDYDMYEICFISRIPAGIRGQRQEVTLEIKHGVEAKNYESFGDVSKLKPMELELRRLEDLSLSVVQDFAYMRQREEEMRNTNESTNSRVLYFSIFSMCCLLGLATWQVLYLRRFFKAKKLIE